MKKKTAETEAELTNKKDDKHPFRKKQQKAISGESFKEKDVKVKLPSAARLGTDLAIKLADVQAKLEKKARKHALG